MLAITLVLFVVALFQKGFTHDLVPEAAIFLASAKLVLLSHNASVNDDAMAGKVAEVSESRGRIEQTLEHIPLQGIEESLSEGTRAASSNKRPPADRESRLRRAPLRRGVGFQHGGIMGPALT